MDNNVNNVINPFAKIEAEDNVKEQIFNFFNRDNDITKKFKEHKHQFIWGTRGSGKSTLLRFFEPYCQFREHGGWENFLAQADAFISFYCPIPRGIVNIDDFKKSLSPSKENISSHYFNMLFAESIISSLINQLDEVEKEDSLFNEFYDFFVTLFDKYDGIVSETSNQINNKEMLSVEKILKLIENEKNHAIAFCAQHGLKKEYQYYAGSLTNYHNFILPFIRYIRKTYKLSVPIFICIDDAGFLMDNEQVQINSWIANRNKEDIIIKVASDPLEYKTFSTVDQRSIRRIHDYDDIFLDVHNPASLKESYKSLINIANRRLKYYYRNPITVECLFPSDPEQDEEIEIAKKNLESNISTINKITDKSRYASRYAMQEFYRTRSSARGGRDRTKIYRTIAGIDDIINLSDYNARTFLRLCNAVFSEKYPKAFSPEKNVHAISDIELNAITPQIQSRAIINHSQEEATYIAKYKPEYSPELISSMQIFINSLGALFRSKMLDFTDKEYGVTGFTTDFSVLSNNEKAVIRVAVECGFLLKYSYTSKDSKEAYVKLKIDSYNLSKKLFPYFNLEPKPCSGRINIAPEIIRKAFTDPREFVRNYKTSKNNTYSDSVQLTLFEEVTIDEDRQNDYSDLF